MNTKTIIAVLMPILISGSVFLTGCSNNSQKLAFRHFEQNELLSPEEKAYAKRSLLFTYKYYHLEGEVTVTPGTLDSQDYKIWGLGAYREFNPAEKAYISGIPNQVRMWEIYKTLDMDDLFPSEKEYLKVVHMKYGPTPSHEDYMFAGKDSFFKEDEEVYDFAFEMVKFLFDFEQIDDFSIILISRLLRQCVI